MKHTLVSKLGLFAAGTALFCLAGCASSDDNGSLAPILSPVASPSVPTVPTASPTPGTVSRAGDFAFAFTTMAESTAQRNVALGADGTGSTAFTLRSVNGFTAPITFPYTVTVEGPVTQPSNTSQTFDSSLASVSLSPNTLVTLPAGSTPVTLSVHASTTLPPLSRITVNLHAEGGGLSRYPEVGAYDNEGKFVFTTPGVSVPLSFLNTLSSSIGSTVTASANLYAVGVTGTATYGVVGLPSGATATFDTPTVTLPTTTDGFPEVTMTVTASSNITPGTYPVHLTLTVGGVTYNGESANLVVQDVFFGN